MKKGEFINLSKRMVREYYNRYSNGPDGFWKIRTSNVIVLDFQDEPDIYRILLVTIPETLFYGVTYYKGEDRIHSYIYENVDNRIIGKKEIINGRR